MTLKLFLRDIAGDAWRWLSPHLRKWSMQIGGLDLFAVYPTLFMLLGFVDARVVLGIACGISALKFLAGLVPQKRVASYDPTTHEVIPIRKREAGDE